MKHKHYTTLAMTLALSILGTSQASSSIESLMKKFAHKNTSKTSEEDSEKDTSSYSSPYTSSTYSAHTENDATDNIQDEEKDEEKDENTGNKQYSWRTTDENDGNKNMDMDADEDADSTPTLYAEDTKDQPMVTLAALGDDSDNDSGSSWKKADNTDDTSRISPSNSTPASTDTESSTDWHSFLKNLDLQNTKTDPINTIKTTPKNFNLWSLPNASTTHPTNELSEVNNKLHTLDTKVSTMEQNLFQKMNEKVKDMKNWVMNMIKFPLKWLSSTNEDAQETEVPAETNSARTSMDKAIEQPTVQETSSSSITTPLLSTVE